MLKTIKNLKFIALGLIFAFFINTIGPVGTVQAQDYALPTPGQMVHLSPVFNPPILKGIKVHPENPFRFDFILDRGDSSLAGQALKDESSKLIKYFMASLTIPEKDLWVNLSPYEKNRIIPQVFGQTGMGRDLLAEDYMLKQITASLIYPEGELGKRFWKRVYEEAFKKFGTTNIPVNTFNKVWIVPEKAVVYENAKAGTAYVVESKLKVMLEQDYLALQKNSKCISSVMGGGISTLGSQIVREIVIPELTKEVNEDKNFAQLRQVYNSLILATWYKKKIKDSILAEVYENKKKVVGVNIDDPKEKQRIYERYLQAFKKGTYNYIKEEIDPITQQTVPRKYFSGGELFTDLAMSSALHIEDVFDGAMVGNLDHEDILEVRIDKVENTAEIFTKPYQALQYLLVHPGNGTYAHRIHVLVKEGMIRPEADIDFYFAASALEHFFAALPEGTSETMHTVTRQIPEAPARLTEANVLRALLESNRKPRGLSWSDFVKLLPIGHEEYEPISHQALARAVNALDHLSDKPENLLLAAQHYEATFQNELQSLAKPYFDSLKETDQADLEKLVYYFLVLAINDQLPKGKRGRKSIGDGGERNGLAPLLFLIYLPTLSYELFLPWVNSWNSQHHPDVDAAMIERIGTVLKLFPRHKNIPKVVEPSAIGVDKFVSLIQSTRSKILRKEFEKLFKDARSTVAGNQTIEDLPNLMKFFDAVFQEAKKMQGDNTEPTRIVFLKAGADPLYEAARLMAQVTGNYPIDKLYSVWATMGNYMEIKYDPRQAQLFIKYLVQKGIITPGPQKILFVDTDTGVGSAGTALIFTRTILDNTVLEEFNTGRGQDPRIGAFNEAAGNNQCKIFYMHISGGDARNLKGYFDEEDILSSITKKATDNMISFDHMPRVAGLWPVVDQFLKIENIENDFIEDADGRVKVKKRAVYDQPYDRKEFLEAARTIQYMGLLTGVLDVLQERGFKTDIFTREFYGQIKGALINAGLISDEAMASSVQLSDKAEVATEIDNEKLKQLALRNHIDRLITARQYLSKIQMPLIPFAKAMINNFINPIGINEARSAFDTEKSTYPYIGDFSESTSRFNARGATLFALAERLRSENQKLIYIGDHRPELVEEVRMLRTMIIKRLIDEYRNWLKNGSEINEDKFLKPQTFLGYQSTKIPSEFAFFENLRLFMLAGRKVMDFGFQRDFRVWIRASILQILPEMEPSTTNQEQKEWEIVRKAILAEDEAMMSDAAFADAYNRGSSDLTNQRTVPRPQKAARINQQLLNQWVRNYDEILNVSANLKSAVEKIAAFVKTKGHIPQSSFEQNLRESVNEFNTILPSGTRYAVVFDSTVGKSSRWVYELAKPYLFQSPVVGIYGNKSLFSGVRKAVDDGIDTFVLFDDAIYTGEVMYDRVRQIQKAYQSIPTQLPKIIVVVPYHTDYAKKILSDLVKVISPRRIAIMEEILNESELNAFYGESRFGWSDGNALNFFDHKVADFQSFPHELADFIENDKTPPYQDSTTAYAKREGEEFRQFKENTIVNFSGITQVSDIKKSGRVDAAAISEENYLPKLDIHEEVSILRHAETRTQIFIFNRLWNRLSGLRRNIPDSLIIKIIDRHDDSFLKKMMNGDIKAEDVKFFKNIVGVTADEERFLWWVFHQKWPKASNRDHYFTEDKIDLIEEYINKNLGQPVSILDIGSGPTGKALVELKKKWGDKVDATGIDLDVETVSHSGVKLVIGDIRSMPFKANEFDIVNESYVMQYIKELPEFVRVLEGIMNILRINGVFIFGDNNDFKNISKLKIILRNLGFSVEFREKLRDIYIIKKSYAQPDVSWDEILIRIKNELKQNEISNIVRNQVISVEEGLATVRSRLSRSNPTVTEGIVITTFNSRMKRMANIPIWYQGIRMSYWIPLELNDVSADGHLMPDTIGRIRIKIEETYADMAMNGTKDMTWDDLQKDGYSNKSTESIRGPVITKEFNLFHLEDGDPLRIRIHNIFENNKFWSYEISKFSGYLSSSIAVWKTQPAGSDFMLYLPRNESDAFLKRASSAFRQIVQELKGLYRNLGYISSNTTSNHGGIEYSENLEKAVELLKIKILDVAMGAGGEETDEAMSNILIQQEYLLEQLTNDFDLKNEQIALLNEVGVDYFAILISGIKYLTHQARYIGQDELNNVTEKVASQFDMKNSDVKDKLQKLIDQVLGTIRSHPIFISKYRPLFAKAFARHYFINGLQLIEAWKSKNVEKVVTALGQNQKVVVVGPGLQGLFMIGKAPPEGHLYLIDNNRFIIDLLEEFKQLMNGKDTIILENVSGPNWVHQINGKVELVVAERVVHELGRTITEDTEEYANLEQEAGWWAATDARNRFFDSVTSILADGGVLIIREVSNYASFIRSLKAEIVNRKEWSIESVTENTKNRVNEINIEISKNEDHAQLGSTSRRINEGQSAANLLLNTKNRQGGIDLTSDKTLIVQNNGQGIKFHIDPAQLKALENAPGFVPVIINIQPMRDIRLWLGINSVANDNFPKAVNDNQPMAMLEAG